MLTEDEEAFLQRAGAHGRNAMARAMAIIYRCGSVETKQAIMARILKDGRTDEFDTIDGSLFHATEVPGFFVLDEA